MNDIMHSSSFGVIVIGGGHAGTEAALASARMKVKTLLITQNIETLGQMSCNPAIGGIGKSHLVKEIDAMGGCMARATDASGIQFRVLNSRKGPAVRATRAQTDRSLYRAFIRSTLENQDHLFLFQQSVDDFILEKNKICGVVTQSGTKFYGDTVVLTVGTFLGGRIHVGNNNYSGGRSGDTHSNQLAKTLRDLPFKVNRLKTGTPPRIDLRSINLSNLQVQPGDKPRPVMSYIGNCDQHPDQIDCYITRTNEQTHDIIKKSIHRSPLYSGEIEGIGPRYCPSIEDKVVRFSDKLSHQIFLEREGLTSNEVYPNGISTSLPFDVQIQLVSSIEGLENAHITRAGYAIEYDFFDPRDLTKTLETRHIEGLFFAGQINGTTGYEEAAAQGLLAGINAALKVQGRPSWFAGRDQSYLGVMVDDLTTNGTLEPYRMFTSRAEYRLILREDNADIRLTEEAYNLGLIGHTRWQMFCEKIKQIDKERELLKSSIVHPGTEQALKINKILNNPITREHRLSDLLKRPELSYRDLILAGTCLPNNEAQQQVEIEIKYEGYIDRQKKDINKLRKNELTTLPKDINYSELSGLSSEVKEKLNTTLPETIGQASRIQGITPAAISLLIIHLKKINSQNHKKTG